MEFWSNVHEKFTISIYKLTSTIVMLYLGSKVLYGCDGICTCNNHSGRISGPACQNVGTLHITHEEAELDLKNLGKTCAYTVGLQTCGDCTKELWNITSNLISIIYLGKESDITARVDVTNIATFSYSCQ